MRLWKSLTAGLILGFTAAPLAAQQAAPADPMNEAAVPGVMQKAVDDVIRPGYASMHASAAPLATAMTTLCSAPSANAAKAAKAATLSAGDAKATVEPTKAAGSDDTSQTTKPTTGTV